jgi:hypothetical protein
LKLKEEKQSFQKYCNDFLANEVTDHGEPFWNGCPEMLEQDVKSGHAYELMPMELYAMRKCMRHSGFIHSRSMCIKQRRSNMLLHSGDSVQYGHSD